MSYRQKIEREPLNNAGSSETPSHGSLVPDPATKELIQHDEPLNLRRDESSPVPAPPVEGSDLPNGRVPAAQHPMETRFRATFERAAVGMAHVAVDGRFLDINQRFCDILGYAREQMLAKTFQDITHPDDLEPDLCHVQRLLAGETANYTMEKRYFNQKGEVVWVDLTVSLIQEAMDEPVCFIAIIEDITQRKQVEAQLQFQSHLLDAVEQAVIVSDIEGRVTYWNPFAEKTYGWTAEEARGKYTLELIAADSSYGDGVEIMARLSSGVSWSGEFIARHREGATFPIHVTLSPIRDENGALQSIIGLSSDISERRRQDHAIRESEARYRNLVEQAHEGVILLLDNTIRFVNSYMAELSGYTVGELINTHIENYLPVDERRRLSDVYQTLVEGGAAPFNYESALIHKNGSRVAVEVSVGLTMYAGRPAELILVRDITERLKAGQELTANRRLLGLVIDYLPVLVSYVDKDRRYRFVNQSYEQYFEKPWTEIVSRPVWAVLGPEGYAAVERHIDAALAGDTAHYVSQFTTPRGELRWMAADYVPDQDQAGEIQGFVALIRDVTRRKEAEASMEKYQKRLQALASQITRAEERERRRIASELHDLRTNEDGTQVRIVE